MITELFIKIFMAALMASTFVFDRLVGVATGDAHNKIVNGLNYFMDAIHKGDNFLPLADLFQISALTVLVQLVFWIFQGIIFVYKRIKS